MNYVPSPTELSFSEICGEKFNIVERLFEITLKLLFISWFYTVVPSSFSTLGDPFITPPLKNMRPVTVSGRQQQLIKLFLRSIAEDDQTSPDLITAQNVSLIWKEGATKLCFLAGNQ